MGALLFAGACGSSNDPQSWAEADEDGNVQPNFIRACTEANNAEGAAGQLTDAQAEAYCRCAFDEIVDYYGGEIDGEQRLDDVAEAVAGRDFDAFKQLESSLRDDPTHIPADFEALLSACTNRDGST